MQTGTWKGDNSACKLPGKGCIEQQEKELRWGRQVANKYLRGLLSPPYRLQASPLIQPLLRHELLP